jgi:hypothetical protein
MGRMVDVDDLVDRAGVARILGLSGPTCVDRLIRTDQRFPSPVWTSFGGRFRLWLQADIIAFAREPARQKRLVPRDPSGRGVPSLRRS